MGYTCRTTSQLRDVLLFWSQRTPSLAVLHCHQQRETHTPGSLELQRSSALGTHEDVGQSQAEGTIASK